VDLGVRNGGDRSVDRLIAQRKVLDLGGPGGEASDGEGLPEW
jgi:hypothetical protein